MRHTFENSSSLAWAEYDHSEDILTIKFHSGKEYRYKDVPEGAYENLIAAQSAGKFFQIYIKPRYELV